MLVNRGFGEGSFRRNSRRTKNVVMDFRRFYELDGAGGSVGQNLSPKVS
jgi:hypothetical protein